MHNQRFTTSVLSTHPVFNKADPYCINSGAFMGNVTPAETSGNATVIISTLVTSVMMFLVLSQKKKHFQEQKQSGLNILFLAVMLVEKYTYSNYQT